MAEWVEWNYESLRPHKLVGTGTTGKLVMEALKRQSAIRGVVPAPKVKRLKSGPLGGDQQLGAMIADGKIDMLIFLWDPMQPQPHDVDVKALLRIAVLYNVPIANNRATADFLVSSTLFNSEYQPVAKDYSGYTRRALPGVKEPDPAQTPVPGSKTVAQGGAKSASRAGTTDEGSGRRRKA
ncbi:MAG: methylglyoxal synthase [Spirochaetaceae bacterium]|nr:MAG: methylglyoxal synthase [Spirochaetaceae bacterium]